MTVSMPLTTWQEYEAYKEKYTELTKTLAGCFDDTLLKAGASASLDFDTKKALAVCKAFLPYSLENADIEMRA
jgi:hypothetical protein